MNILPFTIFVRACDEYLLGNGWVSVAPGKWKVPKRFGVYAGDIYFLWDAIELQYEFDSQALRKKT